MMMELVRWSVGCGVVQGGNDLYGHVTEHEYPYTERDVSELMVQLCCALQFIHNINIIHRDVKMENCLVSHSHIIAIIIIISTQHSLFELSVNAPCGAGAPLFLLVHLLPHIFPFYFSLSFIGFSYLLLLSIPSLSTRIVPLRFQAGGRRRRPNLGLVCVLFCNLCYLYSLVKIDCGASFYLV